jgi:YbbR domain-containing protein
VEVKPEHLNLPRDVRVTSLAPPIVSVIINRIRHKSVAIRPNIVGEPAQGYRMEAAIPNPRTVEVEGAESEVRGLDAIPTEPVDVAGKKESFLQQVALAGTGRPTVLPLRNVLVEVRVRIVPEAPVLGPEKPSAAEQEVPRQRSLAKRGPF